METLEMDFQEETRLTEGKLMFYRHTEDIHTQHPPEALSISINLIFPTHPDAGIQCAINPKSRQLIAHLDCLSATTRLMAIARLMHNGDTINHLQTIALNHHCPRTRAMSFQSLLAINPSDQNRYLYQVSRDQHNYVRALIYSP